ncbi:MAG TPA: hypothetical protein ENK02_12615 [Planctomycetes bacterium]|nr:hypothetical protein [Planctomycetota bacterium]
MRALSRSLLVPLILLLGLTLLFVFPPWGAAPQRESLGREASQAGEKPPASVPSSNPDPGLPPNFPTRGAGRRHPAPRRKGPGIGRTGPRPPQAILFPDGTWLLPINGVKKAPPFPGFPPGRPYAPVVSIYTDPATGLSWYVHADGSRSNVQMVRREEGGRVWEEAGWVVGTPTKSKAIRLEKRAASPSKAGSSSPKK